MTTITRTATLYNSQGYIDQKDVTIQQLPDDGDYPETYLIGSTQHLASDLKIEKGRIEGNAGWYLTFFEA